MSFVDAHDFSAGLVLRVLNIASSTYYDWRARRTSPSPRRCGDEPLLTLIEEIRALHEFAGTLRIAAGVAGACARTGCAAPICVKAGGGSTKQHPRPTAAPDLLGRDFTSTAPNTKWVADLTRILTGEGVLWLASVRDAFFNKGTVTLIEKLSGTSSLVQVATGRHHAVHIQAAALVAVTSCQSANRSAISVRHSGAESLCRLGRKCCEMSPNADRRLCACPGEVKRFIARSRCRVGWCEFSARLFKYFDWRCSTDSSGSRCAIWYRPSLSVTITRGTYSKLLCSLRKNFLAANAFRCD